MDVDELSSLFASLHLDSADGYVSMVSSGDIAVDVDELSNAFAALTFDDTE